MMHSKKMLGERDRWQEGFGVLINILDIIPEDHILRQVDRILDLSWLRKEVREFYSEDQGRPSIDPEAALRLMLAGFLHGIVHDRKLMREAQVNVAIRWFAGYKLNEKLPDHSSLTRIRQRWGPEVFREVFKKTVQMCVGAGLIDGETVHIDATLIRADVSWESIVDVYVNEVRKENDDPDSSDDPPNGASCGVSCNMKKEKRSLTDPDASLTRTSREDPYRPCFKQLTAVDDKCGVVVDVEVITGKAHEGGGLMSQVERVEANTGVTPSRVTADAGYANGENYRMLDEMGIDAVIPPQPEHKRGKSVPASKFKYDAYNDIVRCPQGKILRRSSSVGQGWYYTPAKKACRNCPVKAKCFSPGNASRRVKILPGYVALLKARRRWKKLDEATRLFYERHRWQVEGRHAEAKQQHGLRRAVRRGFAEMFIQVYLTAVAMNLKRLAASFCQFFILLKLTVRPVRALIRTCSMIQPHAIPWCKKAKSPITPPQPHLLHQAHPCPGTISSHDTCVGQAFQPAIYFSFLL